MAVDAKVSEYLLELLRCALSDEVPPAKPEEISWQSVFQLAKRHSVSALAYSAAHRRVGEIPADVAEAWKEMNAKLFTQCCNQEHELALLCERFEREHIPYMPLKGSCIRDLYPQPYQREMSDLDILVQNERLQEAAAVAEHEGYQLKEKTSHNFGFQKPPYMCLELHMNLVPKEFTYFQYYKDSWKFARPTENSCRCRMTWEDYYVYMLVHTAKHYYGCGTGIRSVLDVYLFNRAYRKELDLDYVAAQLLELKLTEFTEQIEALAERWFDASAQGAPQERNTDDMQYYILSSTTYGSRSNFVQNTVLQYVTEGKSLRGAKCKLYLHMVFLPRGEMRGMYPVLDKAPILLPFCWMHRWFRILLRKPDSIRAQYQRVASVKLYSDGDSTDTKA